jgi:protein-disulfide isomerase
MPPVPQDGHDAKTSTAAGHGTRRTVAAMLVLRVALVAAIAASAALVIEYQNPGDPSFCGVGSGCHQVRIAPETRAFSEMLGGVSLPQLGLMAYVALLSASLLARTRVYQLLIAAMAVSGGLFAAYLLYVQKTQIGAFCMWCVIVDVAAVVAAAAAVLLVLFARSTAPDDPVWSELTGKNRALPVWAGVGVLAVVLPFVWGAYPVVPPPPPDLAALAVPGKVTVVQFTDFQCPFCRKLHPVLEELRHRYGDRIAYTRAMKPLSMHPGALPAALAYLCTPEPERDAMADALYRADDNQLTAAGVARLALERGVGAEAFAGCVQSAETKKRLEQDTSLYERIGPRGLPLTFVNARTIIGFDAAKLRKAVEIEAGGGRIGLPVWSLFVALAALTALACAVTLRRTLR